MNIETARQIPINEVVEHLGGVLYKENAKEMLYFSPFRQEKTASFYVRKQINKFKDHGYHRPQGDPIDLVIDFHDMRRNDPEATKFALNYLERFSSLPKITPVKQEIYVTYSDHYQIKKLSDRITAANLKEEVDRRKLPKSLVERFVKQASVYDSETRKTFMAFAFENDKDGHEINNRNARLYKPFKTCIGPKSITTFPAHPSQTEVTAFVFTGFFDFVTWLNMKGMPQIDQEYIITNGDSMISQAGQYLASRKEVIKQVYSFTDHDESGSGDRALDALAIILDENDIVHGSLNHLYDGYKDLSASHMKELEQQNNYRSNSPKTTLRPKY